MDKMQVSIRQGIVAFLVCSALMVAGCGVKVMPSSVPVLRNVETPSLNGASLIVVNAEKDSSDFQILNDKGQNLGFVANKHAWSKKLVESLASELAKRGVLIRANAPLTLGVALPDIILNQIRDTYQLKVKVSVASSKGWSKSYEGIAQSTLGLIESVDTLANRLAGRALSDAVKAMLNDADFLAQVQGKG
jgi:hypothetical protein